MVLCTTIRLNVMRFMRYAGNTIHSLDEGSWCRTFRELTLLQSPGEGLCLYRQTCYDFMFSYCADSWEKNPRFFYT
jgi:hypothetical protein